jgi:hypothetical protein
VVNNVRATEAQIVPGQNFDLMSVFQGKIAVVVVRGGYSATPTG